MDQIFNHLLETRCRDSFNKNDYEPMEISKDSFVQDFLKATEDPQLSLELLTQAMEM